jgi:hypothetical protein
LKAVAAQYVKAVATQYVKAVAAQYVNTARPDVLAALFQGFCSSAI